MKFTTDKKPDEVLSKIGSALAGGKRNVVVNVYVNNEFRGKVEGNKFEIVRTKSFSWRSELMGRVFRGEVRAVPGGSEIEGDFKMSGVVKGNIIGLIAAMAVSIVVFMADGKSLLTEVYVSAVWLLLSILLALCPPLLWRKQERAVVELLENI